MSREESPTPRPGAVVTGQVELHLALMLQHAAVGVLLCVDQIATVHGTRCTGWEGVRQWLKNLGCRYDSLGRSTLGAACHLIFDGQGTLSEELANRQYSAVRRRRSSSVSERGPFKAIVFLTPNPLASGPTTDSTWKSTWMS